MGCDARTYNKDVGVFGTPSRRQESFQSSSAVLPAVSQEGDAAFRHEGDAGEDSSAPKPRASSSILGKYGKYSSSVRYEDPKKNLKFIIRLSAMHHHHSSLNLSDTKSMAIDIFSESL